MFIPRYLAVSIGLSIAGCATQPVVDNTSNQVTINLDCQIARAWERIQAAQAELPQKGAPGSVSLVTPASIGTEQLRLTFSWQGDALQLLDRLARERGLGLSHLGVRMPLPLNIDVQDASYDRVLQLVRRQIGDRGKITQDAERITLQYNRPQP